jgi:hypothetical protein
MFWVDILGSLYGGDCAAARSARDLTISAR